MIAATATADNQRVIVLGITPDNIDQLRAGHPIRVATDTHAGFPADLVVLITWGASDYHLNNQFRPLVSDPRTLCAAHGVPHCPYCAVGAPSSGDAR